MRLALEEHVESVGYHNVAEVTQALEYLSRLALQDTSTAATLILLDLQLRGRSGFEVLMAVKETTSLSHIRVVVFTSSMHAQDETDALAKGAFAYLRKPWTFDGYVSTLREIVGMFPEFRPAASIPGFL